MSEKVPPAAPHERQIAVYGVSWADRLGHLLRAYRIPQSRLAAVIGLSPPMVSQLISGQRVKIASPAVYARVVRLEELTRSPGVRDGDPGVIQTVLRDVAASAPELTTGTAPAGGLEPGSDPAAIAVAHLAAVAEPHALRAAAEAAAGSLRDILLAAADTAARRP